MPRISTRQRIKNLQKELTSRGIHCMLTTDSQCLIIEPEIAFLADFIKNEYFYRDASKRTKMLDVKNIEGFENMLIGYFETL